MHEKSNTRQIAEKRQDLHRKDKPNSENSLKGKRYYKDDKYREQTIGLAGEISLGKKYNLEPDLKFRPKGDNHIDFKIKIDDSKIVTLDVKTYQKAFNLLVKEWEINKCSDILILAEYISETNVNFLGWTTRKIMQQQPTKIFSSLNINNYYLPKDKLYPMERLDELFNTRKIEQIIEQ
jgi:hypothetical protein